MEVQDQLVQAVSKAVKDEREMYAQVSSNTTSHVGYVKITGNAQVSIDGSGHEQSLEEALDEHGWECSTISSKGSVIYVHVHEQ